MDLTPFLDYSLEFADTWKYPLLFVGTIVEGPILMIASGFLLHLGILSFLPLYVTLIAGDLTGDIIWYYIGRYFADPLVQRHGKFIGVTPKMFEKTKEHFHRYNESILFISKITIGFGFALGVLMVAGATGVSFKRYVLLNFLGEVILVAVLLGLGYFFGQMYNYIADGFKMTFLAINAALVVLSIFGFTRYMKNRALKI